jgi:hypothetical protein
MTLFYLFPRNLSRRHSQSPKVSAAHAGIPPVLYLFYQEGTRPADRRQLALAPPVTILP